MKYLVVIPDGAADYPIEALGGRTPLEAAKKPNIDAIAKKSYAGTVNNVPPDMVPESDTANIAILSYDPKIYSHGRSPLEAVSMGLDMQPDEIAFRCNVVTLSDDEDYDNKTMVDHSADEITTAEAAELIAALQDAFGEDGRTFYPGVSYRHCLIWRNPPEYTEFMRPHDILGRKITEYLPPEPYATLQRRSFEILNHHPVNEARRARDLRSPNPTWPGNPCAKPALPPSQEKWGLDAAVISAVDLIKGIGICAKMKSIDVPGATGNINTNFSGKADAAIKAFRDGEQLVYIHVEAPDECGHRTETENKVRSIELIDEKIVGPVTDYLKSTGEPYSVMILPDHPTPVCRRTHTLDAVPFIIYNSEKPQSGIESFTENKAEATGVHIEHGYNLMEHLIQK